MDSRLKRAAWRGAMVGVAAAAAIASAATFNLFQPANGILKGNPSTYITTAAGAGDVIGLWSATCNDTTYLRGDGQCEAPPGSGGGTVDSVGLTMPSGFTVTGSPVTGSSVLAVTTTLSGVLLGTGSGISTAAASDVVGLFSGTCSSSTDLRGDGSCQTAGTVTSSTITVPSPFLVNGSSNCTITSSGNCTITWATGQTANEVLASPNGSSGAVGLRALVGADIPAINLAGTGNGGITGSLPFASLSITSANVIGLWTGTCSSSTWLRGDGACVTPGGSGTVTSVALTAPSVFTVGGTPVTGAGTLALTFAGGQTANSFLATPNGSSGAVGLRTLVAGDLPSSITSNTSGNAATATAAASSPTQCSSGQYAMGVTTAWAANCATVAYSQLSGTPTITFANPTASVGLSAVNGSATTFMRSDAAPALSQAISPTWTGVHVFTGLLAGSNVSGVSLGFDTQNPLVHWTQSAGATNSKIWAMYATTTDFRTTALNDAQNAEDVAIDITRSGTTITSLVLGNATDNPAIVLHGGAVVGTPTGGNEGAGTVNATGLFVNGLPVLTSASGASTVKSGVVTTATSSCVVNQNNGIGSTCTYNGVGNFTITFATAFSTNAACVVTPVNGFASTGGTAYSQGSPTTAVSNITMRNLAGAGADGSVSIVCVGT